MTSPTLARAVSRTRRSALALVVAAALALAACSSDGERTEGGDAAFYEGQTIELIIPFDPGGGSDTIGRLIADILSDTIEGEPTVTVRNVPGADGLIGHNEFAAANPDGMTLFFGGGSGNLYQVFGHADASFDYAAWYPVLGVPQGAVVYVSPDAGIEQPADLLDPPTELTLAAGSPEGSDLSRLAALDLLQVPFRPIFGFAGGGETRLAFQQGQASMTSDLALAYIQNVEPLVESGEAAPLFTLGMYQGGELITDPAFPDLPTVADLYAEIHDSAPDGMEYEAVKLLVNAALTFNKVLFIHDGAPQEAKDALAAGVAAVLDDQRYVDAVTDVLGGYDFSVGEAVVEDLESITTPDPDVVAWVTEYARERYDAQIGAQ